MKVALGIPVIDGVPGETFSSHLATAVEIGRAGEIVFITPTDVFPVERARDFIWDTATKMKCDYLMSVDFDVVLPKGAFSSLLETMIRTKSQIVTGKYYLRGYPYANIWAIEHEHKRYFTDSDQECKLDGCGMGCALLDVAWINAHLKPPFWRTKYEKGEFETEDFFFCSKIREAGGVIIGEPKVACGHLSPGIVVTSANAQALRVIEIEKEHLSGNLD